MRIGHCQFVSKPGDFEGNLAKVVQGLEKAHKDRVEVLSFPECFLTGYQDTEEEVRKHAFAADSARMMQVLDRTSRFDPTVIVLGFFVGIVVALSIFAAPSHWRERRVARIKEQISEASEQIELDFPDELQVWGGVTRLHYPDMAADFLRRVENEALSPR